MARLPYLDKSDLSAENQDLLARNINLVRALVHSPDGARAFGALATFIRFKSAPARAGHPASRLPDSLALRIFASREAGPRIRGLG